MNPNSLANIGKVIIYNFFIHTVLRKLVNYKDILKLTKIFEHMNYFSVFKISSQQWVVI